jgi:hypothetical protein
LTRSLAVEVGPSCAVAIASTLTRSMLPGIPDGSRAEKTEGREACIVIRGYIDTK